MKNKNLSPQLIKLLLKTRDFILKYPEKFDQGNDEHKCRSNGCQIRHCETPQCILGWMRMIYRGKKEVEELFPERSYSRKLYLADEWPSQFKLREENYLHNYWSGITAKTAAKRIMHFIKTDGRE